MSETDRLFPEYQLLSWLPDETFFSLVSRHHQLWGHVTSAQTCQLIFGSARAGTHHDLPNSLGAFSQRTNALLGEVDFIARERTLLKFYAAFAPPGESENAVACMSSASVAHLKLRLGILTSRFRANHPLKACPQCMEQDLRETGWAYWHLKHQFPGVWMCTTHKQPLLQSALKANGVERFQWLLPRLSELNPASVAPIETIASPVLLSLAELIEHLVQSAEHQPLLLGKLHEVYRQELHARGWIAGVLKILSAEITHKSDVGGVAVNLSAETIGARLTAMASEVEAKAGVLPKRFLVQEMVGGGTELILGMHRDALGTAILLGMGGVTAELFKDTTMRLLPPTGGLSRADALAMAQELKTWPLLDGFRGRPLADVDALVTAIVAFSQMAAQLSERLVEAEINPVFVLPKGQGVRAADGVVVLA